VGGVALASLARRAPAPAFDSSHPAQTATAQKLMFLGRPICALCGTILEILLRNTVRYNLRMELEILNTVTEKPLSVLYKVTPLSKYLAMTIFIIMPFIGGWIGYNYAPEKNVLVETIIYKNIDTAANSVAEVKQAAEEPTSMIEGGEIVISLINKTFEATVMFGLGDVITVKGEYSQQEDVLIEVLKAVKNTGRNAGYVDENRIKIIELE
jgi:hypothetical protein